MTYLDTANPSPDRLSFTLFVAALLHGVLVFGVVFTAPKVTMPHVMEVTLAQHKSSKADKKADFLADANQQGSGVLEKAALVTSPHQSKFEDQRIQQVQPEPYRKQMQEQQAAQQKIISTTAYSSNQVNTKKHQEQKIQTDFKQAQMAQIQQSDDIASLEARLAAKKQAYAKRPRIRSLSTISTQFDRDAAYLDAFRTRVEEIGNKNYPALAKQRKIYGSVRLMVSILANGQVQEIVTLKSSGSALLDEAARQSVRLSSPFLPFPSNIRQDTDILQIIRTWKFGEQFTSEN